MPNEESKPVIPSKEEEAIAAAVKELAISEGGKSKISGVKVQNESISASAGSSSAQAQTQSRASPASHAEFIDGLSPADLALLVAQNPGLSKHLSPNLLLDQKALRKLLKSTPAHDLVTTLRKGTSPNDMDNHKFWVTQPVMQWGEEGTAIQDGQIVPVDREKASKRIVPLIDGFEWVDMKLTEPAELEEVRALLSAHYVEDEEALFRFNYHAKTLQWALLAPGFKWAWHVGVRATKSRKLVAFISSTPLHLRMRDDRFSGGEVNFLCIHKKLRSKRLAPVMIQEIVRRNYQLGIQRGTYTGGTLLPTPVASCRYYHRALDWEKLYNCGFSPMPPNSTKARQIAKYKLPDRTSTLGLRAMEEKDLPQVNDLLARYLNLMTFAQEFESDETKHWFLNPTDDPKSSDRVVYSYVVEDRSTKKLTDFFSFYCLESTIINPNGPNNVVKAAYLFYYATESAFSGSEKVLADRLNALIRDALILAKMAKFDVFNALTLMDNPLFLDKQFFGAGDGQLHYYLYNMRAAPVNSGVDAENRSDVKNMRGIGFVML